jgi:hypothetical protein
MMNLEHIEQKCLNYLMQVKNPLVPISTLMTHLNDDEQCRGVLEQDLIDFLRKHELFRVMDPPSPGEGSGADADWPSDGIDSGPRVILVTRIPTPAEMAAMIEDQMEKMTKALSLAQAEAAEAGDADGFAKISEVMKRAEALAKKLGQTIGGAS